MNDIYAPDKPRVNTLYFEDFRALYLLPKEKFDATTYKEVTADSYGRICAEEKHIYTTRPEYAGHKVQIGISVHYVDIYTHEGKILIRHKREFGPERTISRDYSTTIDLLMSRPAAWWSSGIRLGGDMSDKLRKYFDQKSVSERRSLLGHLRMCHENALYE